MTVPAGEKCPSCGSIMKQSPGTQPGVTIWTCVRCKTEKAKTVVYTEKRPVKNEPPNCKVCKKPMVFVRRFTNPQGEGVEWKCPTCRTSQVTDMVIKDAPAG